MKSEQIKEITEKATEQLVAALQQGRSEALTSYLKRQSPPCIWEGASKQVQQADWMAPLWAQF